MSSKDCINEINKFLPGKLWKRISKKTAVITKRVFSSPKYPANVIVLEDEAGKLSVSIDCGPSSVRPKPPKRLNKKDYCFQHEKYDGEHRYWIVPKAFFSWDKYHHFDERVNQSNMNMPDGFIETMEACFEFAGDEKEAVRLLLEAGFAQLPDKKD